MDWMMVAFFGLGALGGFGIAVAVLDCLDEGSLRGTLGFFSFLFNGVFSGVGIFLASLWIDRRRHERSRRNLLAEALFEVHRNATQLRFWPSPLRGRFPLRRQIMEQVVGQRPVYFSLDHALNRCTDRLDSNIGRLEGEWEVDRRSVPETGNDVEGLDRKWNLELIITLHELQRASREIERRLNRRATTIVIDGHWARRVLALAQTARDGSWGNPLLTDADRAAFRLAWEWMMPIARAVLEGSFDPERDMTDANFEVTLPPPPEIEP